MAAHLMTPDVDYGENITSSYWREFAECSDGTFVIGTGETPQQAESMAAKRVVERESYLKLPGIERLKILLKGDLLDTDKKEAIRILAKLLIERTQ